MLYENSPKKKNDIFHCVRTCLNDRTIVRCAEEELRKILFIALSVGTAGQLLTKIITNAIKMLPNQNAPFACKCLNIRSNTTKLFHAVT